MPLTQSQLVGEVAERAGLSKADTKAVFDALEEVVLGQLADAEKVKIAGVVQLTQRARMPRPRLGVSGLPVGEAVRRNLEERKATTDTLEALDDAAEVLRPFVAPSEIEQLDLLADPSFTSTPS